MLTMFSISIHARTHVRTLTLTRTHTERDWEEERKTRWLFARSAPIPAYAFSTNIHNPYENGFVDMMNVCTQNVKSAMTFFCCCPRAMVSLRFENIYIHKYTHARTNWYTPPMCSVFLRLCFMFLTERDFYVLTNEFRAVAITKTTIRNENYDGACVEMISLHWRTHTANSIYLYLYITIIVNKKKNRSKTKQYRETMKCPPKKKRMKHKYTHSITRAHTRALLFGLSKREQNFFVVSNGFIWLKMLLLAVAVAHNWHRFDLTFCYCFWCCTQCTQSISWSKIRSVRQPLSTMKSTQ